VKILIYCPVFLPHVGGLEICTAQLAEEFAAAGHDVTVFTATPGEDAADCGYRTIRSARAQTLLQWVGWCDVFFHANVSLRGLWPLLLIRRPWIVSHHGWYSRPDRSRAWQDRLKRFVLNFASASISVSAAVAADLETPSLVIGNPYRDRIFGRMLAIPRDKELLFVGRLVSDKGIDVLLDALGQLAVRDRRPELTIVGDGPERRPLEDRATRLGIRGQITLHACAQLYHPPAPRLGSVRAGLHAGRGEQ
jgi:glycosyltransferase involved in cell wall biosynthesis